MTFVDPELSPYYYSSLCSLHSPVIYRVVFYRGLAYARTYSRRNTLCGYVRISHYMGSTVAVANKGHFRINDTFEVNLYVSAITRNRRPLYILGVLHR